MVFLIFTRGAFDELRSATKFHLGPVWVNSDVVSADEARLIRDSGTDLTTFTQPIDPNNEMALKYAIATIREHHLGQTIWVEQ